MAKKYGYLYSAKELGEIAARVRAYEPKVRRVAVTFNNNPAVTALDLKRLLGLLDTPA